MQQQYDDRRQRAGIGRNLLVIGVAAQRVEPWLQAWEAEAAMRGIERNADYWKHGWEWIRSEITRRR
jgi:hypothetical protein